MKFFLTKNSSIFYTHKKKVLEVSENNDDKLKENGEGETSYIHGEAAEAPAQSNWELQERGEEEDSGRRRRRKTWLLYQVDAPNPMTLQKLLLK